MTHVPLGSLPSGEAVEAYTLTNRTGASATVLTLGGIVTSLRMAGPQRPIRRHRAGFQ